MRYRSAASGKEEFLAFLAPDILSNTLDGGQPLGFTSDWCMRHAWPADWNEQRDLLATL
jgi:site-specific DNA recombinase